MADYQHHEVGPLNMAARARSWCFTFNNYTPEDEVRIQGIASAHTVYGREVGEEGTPHLQGFIRFNNQKVASRVVRLLAGCHVSIARFIDRAIVYCRKDGDVFERGSTVPQAQQRREAGARGNEANAAKWTAAYVAAQEGRLDDIPADIKFKYGNAIERIRLKRLSDECPDSIAVLDNWWYWGPSGTGKSTAAREENPGAYFKMRNKWWDGYEYEPVVILDDVDPSMDQWIQSFLKDWADHHKFRCEVKGHSAVIRPRRIVVTSQYPIERVFKDAETVAALKRRFQVRYFAFIGPLPDFGPPHNVEQDDRFR